MRILLAEDDFVTRKFMMNFLSSYGEPYDLACLDIMMPVMDGYQVLRSIRDLEADHGIPEEEQVKVIMTTALNDEENVKMAFDLGCSVYSGKPINKEKFDQALKKLGLI